MLKSSDNKSLQINHVSKRYGSGSTEVTAVHDVSLSVNPGEIVLIMGPSGSGKTTLLSMLGALLKPSEGSIKLNGDFINEMKENRLPDIRLRQFGFIFQDFNLLSALSALVKAKPATAKGRYLVSVTLSSTMGPGVKIDPAVAQKLAS